MVCPIPYGDHKKHIIPMKSVTYGQYHTSHRETPPIGWYQIILLGDRLRKVSMQHFCDSVTMISTFLIITSGQSNLT